MAINAGPNLNSVPASQQQTLSSNYLDLSSASNAGWAQQYLPDLMEKEAEVFGPRTISGFLSQVGAEESMTADQVIWSEQGRLHLSYKGEVKSNVTIQIQSDIDGNNSDTTNGISGNNSAPPPVNHGIRVNDTVIIASANGVHKCLVTGVDGSDADLLTIAPYGAANLGYASTAALGATILVYGSEFSKGVGYNAGGATLTESREANEPSFKTFTNKPIIMKDYYEVSGSDASRIGWVEIAAEDGQSGYLWYLKAEADTRARFNDYLEMALLEAEKGQSGTTVDATLGTGTDTTVGSEGLFAAIEDRGNITSGVTGVNAATDLAEFDAILAIDDMLASMNSYGAGGTSYGVFENDEDMALNLGFSGFRRGSYDFYKSDFRYLNDLATRGGINDAYAAGAIRGVIIPAGTSTVYDQQLGKNLKRPFLHVRYRASQTDNRKMKTWTTGSVGAATSALDAMQIHFLSERCLVVQGANNFMLMK